MAPDITNTTRSDDMNSEWSAHAKQPFLDSSEMRQEVYQTMNSTPTHCVWGIAAILLNIAITAFLVIVIFVPIKLTSSGILQGELKTLYNTGVTILAGACTTFTLRCIRALWLRKVDVLIYSHANPATTDPLWRTVLGIRSLQETLRIWGPTLVLLGCALTTAAIVGALTGTSATHREDHFFSIVNDGSYLCVGLASSPPAAYYWNLPNGSQYQVLPSMQFCPAAEALTLMGGISAVNPATFGYAENGVAVGRAALGTPAAIYSSESAWSEGASYNLALVDPLRQYGTSLLSTSQCVPVMNSNPVQWKTAAANYAGGILTPERRQLKGKTPIRYFACMAPLVKATIIIAAIYPSAVFLAESIDDAVWLQAYDNNQSTSTLPYAIECAVEAAPVFQYRDVTLSLQNSSASADIGTYSRSLDAADLGPCVPDGMADGEDPLKAKLPAIAATAALQPLFYDWVGTTRQLTISPGNIYEGSHTIFIRPPPFAFSNSRNAMEDVLGLVSALVASKVSVTGGSNSKEYSGSAQILYTRIGTGNPWALLYLLPPLTAGGALIYLWIATRGI